MKIEMKIHIPSLPNYLFVGDDKEVNISVSELTNEQIEKLGEEWTEALKAHALKRKTVLT